MALYANDFEYDGRRLSEFGFTVCEFGINNSNHTSAGSDIVFSLAPVMFGRRQLVTGSHWETTLNATISICKDPCKFDGVDMTVRPEEFRALSRWLNRRQFLWFHPIDDERPDLIRPWFRASFLVKKVENGGEAVGLELSLTTDSPFGYGEEIVESHEFTSGDAPDNRIIIIDRNDEAGVFYPDAEIECGDDGELKLTNETTRCVFRMQNCISGEKIIQNGDVLTISSVGNDGHDIANDFNYGWFSLGNSYDDRENAVTASMPCTLRLRYRPVWKDTL